MFEFINYLKLIATALITNSHFGNVWPVSALATGGLLGNVIFFAVSGYLLYNIKTSFIKWFSKRFFRVYPALAMFTLFTVCIGKYPLNGFEDAFKLFVYPTNYIFLVWLIVCYVIFYVIAYMDKIRNNFLEILMSIIFIVWILVYILFYDKSVYCVDDVSKPFILFLYMESMLMGAFFKKYHSSFSNFRISKILITVGSLAVYFVSKIAFSRVDALVKFQILNQFIILFALFSVFTLFISIEPLLNKLPLKLNIVVKHISNITLQIYVVQFVIIKYFEKIPFPFNLIVVTVGILVVATILYYIEALIKKAIVKLKK